MRTVAAVMLSLLIPAFLVSASRDKGVGGEEKGKQAAHKKAIAVLHGLGENHVRGTVVFLQKDGYIEVSGEITGLTPGEHAFHVHEFGDCSAPDGMSAGPHFNPDMKPHGGPHDENRHVGDLGNLTADENGKATVKLEDKIIQLHGPHSIIGRSLIVHAMADDLKSQPAGNAGGRIGCAVIGIAKP